jgi:hypothetical protein
MRKRREAPRAARESRVVRPRGRTQVDHLLELALLHRWR